VRESGEILNICSELRREIWIKIFPEVNPYMQDTYKFLEKVGSIPEDSVLTKDR